MSTAKAVTFYLSEAAHRAVFREADERRSSKSEAACALVLAGAARGAPLAIGEHELRPVRGGLELRLVVTDDAAGRALIHELLERIEP